MRRARFLNQKLGKRTSRRQEQARRKANVPARPVIQRREFMGRSK
jgi:hypothetical protein